MCMTHDSTGHQPLCETCVEQSYFVNSGKCGEEHHSEEAHEDSITFSWILITAVVVSVVAGVVLWLIRKRTQET
eukprot:UN18803